MVYPTIMCGGSGTRLWPVSRPSRPKQFVPLVGPTTLFQDTVDRVRDIDGFKKLVVVSGAKQARWISAQLPQDLETDILLEPEGRDSAAAIAAASHMIHNTDPEGILIILASDHHVPDKAAFHEVVAAAIETARQGRIVTLGIQPDHPSPAYGYIKPASSESVSTVEAFVEKPDAETAADYIARGYLWNSGNFIARADVLLEEMTKYIPDVVKTVGDAVSALQSGIDGKLLPNSFCEVSKISIDFGVMEKTDRASVVSSPLQWSDLGAWDAVHSALPSDESGNAVLGQAEISSSRDSLIFNRSDRLCVAEGVEELSIVVDDDCIFVSKLSRSQRVKDVVEGLKERGAPEIDIVGKKFDLGTASRNLTQWLFAQALPLWWTHGFDHEAGRWREELSQEAHPTDAVARARVQGRQTFCYALAGRLGWAGPSTAALGAGFEAVRSYCQSPHLLSTLVAADGTVLDERVLLYDQTFHILALAAASPYLDHAEQRALTVLDAIEASFERAGKGYRENDENPYQSNAHMHLFEACLEWIENGGCKRWEETAGRILDLAMTKLIDENGVLREFFDEHWQPAAGKKGRIVEPGHLFEWSWLLQRWALRSSDGDVSDVARKLFRNGLKGVDPVRDLAVDTINDNLQRVTERARLWPQTERLKAALLLAENATDDLDQRLEQISDAENGLLRYLATPVSGLWFDKNLPDGTFVSEPSPASSLYHIMTAIVQMQKTAAKIGNVK